MQEVIDSVSTSVRAALFKDPQARQSPQAHAAELVAFFD